MLGIAAVAALTGIAAQRQANVDDDDMATGTSQRVGVAAGRRALRLLTRQAVVLRHGGEAALREMLATPLPTRSRPPRVGLRIASRDSVRVVDTSGADLLGREVPARALAVAKRRIRNDRPGAMAVRTPGGMDYLLFIPVTPEMRQNARRLPWYWRLSPAIIGLIGLGFSVLFSGLLAWYLARPIRALRRGFDQVADGNLDTRVSQHIGARRDELADLGSHFDKTIDRLQQVIQSQQRLLHDVSHELRSPLARIQVAIGLMQQRPEKAEEMIQRVERESTRLDTLVGEILTLSRMDDRHGPGPVEAFDLDDMLADIATDARLEGTGRSIDIAVHGTAGELTGSPELLQRAVENLVRNALKYTADHSTVAINAERTNQQVVIGVRDHGPGVTEDELRAMTEPFVRGGAAPGDLDGYGLGLAIAQRAIEIHQGTLEFENLPDGGLLATIKLPLSSS